MSVIYEEFWNTITYYLTPSLPHRGISPAVKINMRQLRNPSPPPPPLQSLPTLGPDFHSIIVLWMMYSWVNFWCLENIDPGLDLHKIKYSIWVIMKTNLASAQHTYMRIRRRVIPLIYSTAYSLGEGGRGVLLQAWYKNKIRILKIYEYIPEVVRQIMFVNTGRVEWKSKRTEKWRWMNGGMEELIHWRNGRVEEKKKGRGPTQF